MKTYEERTQAVLDMVEKKRRRRRAIVATVSSVVPCLVVLMVTLAVFLPTAGGLSSDKSVEMAADRSSSSPYGESAANAEDVDLYAAKVAASPYRHVLETYPKKSQNTQSSQVADDASGKTQIIASAEGSSIRFLEDASSVKIVSSWGDAYVPNLSSSGVVGTATPADGEAYIENTNTQVAGVKEGDILKESTHYFYRLTKTYTEEDKMPNGKNYYDRRVQIEIFRKEGLATACDVSFDFLPFGENVKSISLHGMFLSDDCRTIYVVTNGSFRRYDESGVLMVGTDSKVSVVALDVSDLSAIRVKESTVVSGSYRAVRLVGDNLLVFSAESVPSNPDPDDPETFVPYVEENGVKKLCAPDAIERVGEARSMYFVMTVLGKDLSLEGQVATLRQNSGRLPVFYVSESRAYVVDIAYKNGAKMGVVTQITSMEYASGHVRLGGSFFVEGRVDNQYWLDEHEGVLRVVSTVDDEIKISSTAGNNANLTCFAVGTWDIVGQVTRFAPEGESVRSVRYVGNKAYVCTAIVAMRTISDPVYCFDLSDYAHIGVVDTGTIEGFSSTLTPFADDTMLGIGCETASDVKLELYRETDVDVQSVCSLVLGGKEILDEEGNYALLTYTISAEYKAFLFNAKEGVVGLPCTYTRTKYVWSDAHGRYMPDTRNRVRKTAYVLCVYEEGELRVAETVLSDEAPQSFRAAIAGDYAYIFGVTTLNVVPIGDLR